MYEQTISQITADKQIIKKIEKDFINNVIKAIENVNDPKLIPINNSKILKLKKYSDLVNWDYRVDDIKNFLIKFCEEESFNTILVLVKTLEETINNNTNLYIYENVFTKHKFHIKADIKEKEYPACVTKYIPNEFCKLLYNNLKSISVFN